MSGWILSSLAPHSQWLRNAGLVGPPEAAGWVEIPFAPITSMMATTASSTMRRWPRRRGSGKPQQRAAKRALQGKFCGKAKQQQHRMARNLGADWTLNVTLRSGCRQLMQFQNQPGLCMAARHPGCYGPNMILKFSFHVCSHKLLVTDPSHVGTPGTSEMCTYRWTQ